MTDLANQHEIKEAQKSKENKNHSYYKKISVSMPVSLYEELKAEAKVNFALGLYPSTVSEVIRDALTSRKIKSPKS